MPNPLDYFSIGEKIGKANQFPGVKSSENVLDVFNQQAESNTKLKDTVGASMALKKYENELPQSPLQAAQTAYYKQRTENPTGGRLTPKDIADRKKETLRVTGAGGMSDEINSAKQVIKSTTKVRNILFPTGKPDSFRRDIAAQKGNFLRKATISKDAQNLAREYGIALDLYNKGITGAAFPQQEYERRVSQFQQDLLSNPEAALDSINRLEEMSHGYLKMADPQGIFAGEGEPVPTGAEKPVWNELQEQAKLQRLVTANPKKKDFLMKRFEQRKKEALGVAE